MSDNTSNQPRNIIAVGALVLGLFMPIGTALADSPEFAPNSKPFGKTFREWSAEWWQFVLSFPASENPIGDISGEKCMVGQRGPVWFLLGTGGGTVNRRCTVPEGKALFFPVLNLVDVNVANQTAEELRAEIGPCVDAVTSLSVTVDNKPIQNLQNRARVRSKVFEITLPEGNLFGIDAGVYSPVVADGFYVMLKPLSVGQHTVRFSGAIAGCPFSPTPFELDVTYELDVKAVRLEDKDKDRDNDRDRDRD